MLRFVNNHATTVWVMIEFHESECHQPDASIGGQISLEPWQGMGWWRIDPGRSVVVYENDLDDVNRYWYYEAHTADGTVWAGEYIEYVSYGPFNACSDLLNGDYRIGMRELDIGGSSDYTVTLT